ncbi:MAG: hypothetical protein H0U57_08145 [Tatlockia sp.]|nr:hypothetical protein [Tatlockia sp.]
MNVPVWLSIINCQQLLVEKYKSIGNISSEKILKEINTIINQITDFASELEEAAIIETLSSMLFACANGYRISDNPRVYIQKASDFVKMYENILLAHQDKTIYTDTYESIFRYLKILGINENPEELELNFFVDDCLKRADQLKQAQQATLKESFDFDVGTLVSSPEKIIRDEPEILKKDLVIKQFAFNGNSEELQTNITKNITFFKPNQDYDKRLEISNKGGEKYLHCVLIEPYSFKV